MDLGLRCKKIGCFIHRHFEHIKNGFPFEKNLKRLSIETSSPTGFTGNLYIAEKLHLDGLDSCSLAVRATSAFDIERKSSFFVTPCFGFRNQRKQVTDGIKQLGIGCRIAPWSSSNRGLVDFDQTVQVFQAFNFVMFTRSLIGVWNEVIRYSLFQNPIDQGRFSGSGDSCNTDKQAQGNLHGEILEVVETRTVNSKIPVYGNTPCFRNFDAFAS